MKLKNKKKIELFLTEEWKLKIQNRATQLGSSMAEIIKRAIEEYFTTHP
jgi:hypothetical protein